MNKDTSTEELAAQVTLNPHDDTCYHAVLSRYQDCCDNNEDPDGRTRKKLEDLRVMFALHCNPPIDFWMSWLTDVVIEANTDDSYVSKVFQKQTMFLSWVNKLKNCTNFAPII